MNNPNLTLEQRVYKLEILLEISNLKFDAMTRKYDAILEFMKNKIKALEKPVENIITTSPETNPINISINEIPIKKKKEKDCTPISCPCGGKYAAHRHHQHIKTDMHTRYFNRGPIILPEIQPLEPVNNQKI